MTAGKPVSKRNGHIPGTRCAVIWTLVILAATLFPYGPVPGRELFGNLARFNPIPFGHPLDFLANILLFLPWGFCAAGIPSTRRSRENGTWIALGIGLVLSAMVEFLQLGLPSRNPALADILANLLGVMAGLRLESSYGPRWRAAAESLETRLETIVSIRVLLGLLVLHAVLVGGLFGFSRYRTSFAGWDSGFHLNLGNESTGDRPWSGSLGEIRLWSSVLPIREIDRLLAGEPPSRGQEGSLVWSFDPSRPLGADSAATYAPDLVWRPGPPQNPQMETVHLSKNHWLTSVRAAAPLTASLQQAGRFTLSVTAATDDTAQTGPGRIVSVSADPWRRNFTLGQEGPDLVFRLRTPFTGLNGSDPALIVPGVFAGTAIRHLVVTCDGSDLSVYLGAGVPPARLDLKYAGVFTGMGFRYDPENHLGYKVVFWGLVGLPPVFLLFMVVSRIRKRRPPVTNRVDGHVSLPPGRCG